MRSRSSLLVTAALALAPLACSRESAPAPPPPPATRSETPPSGAAPTRAELEQKLDDYLGREKQAYNREAARELDAKQRADLDIPVPPVDSLEVEKPDLKVPAPEEPAERP